MSCAFSEICRSPLFQGVFEEVVRREGLLGKIEVDSAGIYDFYSADKPPDPRAQRSAPRRVVDINAHKRARLLERKDCESFDYVLTMDGENYERMAASCQSAGAKAVVRLSLEFAPEREVPDALRGIPGGFNLVMDLAGAGSEGLLEDIRERHLKSRIV